MTDHEFQTIMTEAVHEFRQNQLNVIESLSALNAQMHILMGNGQPGRITTLETDVTNLRLAIRHLKGFIAGVCAVGSILGLVVHYFILH